MLIFAIDDEPKMLRLLHKAIVKAAPDAEVKDYALGTEAITAIEDGGLTPDVVFSDIRMPKLDGLQLAVRLKTLVPDTKVVFVTGYNEYALDAFRVRAHGYLMKPVEPEHIRRELDYMLPRPALSSEKLRVQCFGKFEVFYCGKPLQFERLQTKELLAYLIDQNGASCTSQEVAAVIWDDETEIKVLTHRLRNLVADLRATLRKIGQEDIIIKSGRTIAVNRAMIDCDYYRMLDGDMDAVNSFCGEYMTQYTWATLTEGKLHFLNQK